MSDELLNQDLDVEGHGSRTAANDEPSDEVEAHGTGRYGSPKYGSPKYGANDEPEDEVEAHVRRAG